MPRAGQARFGIAMASIRQSGMSFNGFLLMMLGLSLALSGFDLRFELMGLRVHPYLIVVALIFPLLAAFRLKEVPWYVLVSLTSFVVIYFLSTFSGGVAIGEGLKIFASLTTIFCAALLVRTWSDFSMGVFGLSLAIAFLGVYGLNERGLEEGVQAIEHANRNAYSLYALPVILLGGFVALRREADYLVIRLIIVGCMFAATLAIVLSLNRSGWLGVLLIAIMLFRDRRVQGFILVLFIATASIFTIGQYFDMDPLEQRIERTTRESRSESNRLRIRLIRGCLELGLENPIFGTSPQDLPHKLARKIGYPRGSVYPHNTYAHIIGGSGFFCFFAFLYAGWVLWTWRARLNLPLQFDSRFKEVHRMLRMMLFLWAARAFFTHEILYAPGFSMGIGLCIGLCMAFTPKAHRLSDVAIEYAPQF